MKTLIFIACISLIGLSFESCNKANNAGPLTTETRVLTDSVTSIIVKGSIDVFITTDSTYDLRIEAGTNVIPKIETVMDGNQLTVYQRGDFYSNTNTRVYVSTAYLKEISLDGSGNILGDNLNIDHVFVKLNGSGDIHLDYNTIDNIDIDLQGSGNISITGNCLNNNLELKGSGDINCRYLIADNCNADLEGSGTVKVHANNSIIVNSTGSGSLFFWGNPPSKNINQSGSGNVSQQ